MSNQLIRLELLIGKEAIAKLANSSVAIFGIGGVGSYIAEALARSGVGRIALIDNDIIDITNLNRQIHALHTTVGKNKTLAMKQRIQDIDPNINIECYDIYYDEKTQNDIDLSSYDYVADAIDSITSKILLITNCKRLSVPIISSMGTGNKLNPTMLEITDIYKTSVCPLARVLRRELKSRGVSSLRVVYSKEQPIDTRNQKLYNELLENTNKRQLPGSSSFVPSTAGLILASEIVKNLINCSL